MSKFREWLGTFGDAASIAALFGVSLISLVSGLSAAWAHAEKLRASYILVVSLIVFVSLLWSWVGLVWIFDRAKKSASDQRPEMECPWGLILEGHVIRLDPTGPLNFQIAIQIKNTVNFPLRAEVISNSVEIEKILPDQTISEIKGPFIVMPGPSMTFSFPAFSKGRIPDQDRLKGSFQISIKYGHVDGGYSRVMSRSATFDQAIRPIMPEGLFAGISLPVISFAGQIALAVTPSKEDEDKPYKA